MQVQNISQLKAADPDFSVWVSASAGTGKTKVLTDRVLRLLLSDTMPEKILCLTFTNAAASEMKARITDSVQSWQNNIEDLERLLSRKPTKDEINLAQSLFTRLLLSPEQLSIYTIHSFCQKILQKFPFEAGVQPGFKVLAEMEMKEIIEKLIKDVAFELRNKIKYKSSFEFVLRNVHQLSFNDLISEIISNQINFRDLFDHYNSAQDYKSYLMQEAGIKKDQRKYILELISRLKPLSYIPENLGENELKLLESYNLYMSQEDKIRKFPNLINCFFTKAGSVRKKILTKKHSEEYPDIASHMAKSQELVIQYYEYIKKANMIESTIHIYNIADYLLSKYSHYKHKLSSLDYDDLIYFTKKLLGNSEMQDWVLFKLDGGISHLLIDEAQDTSPKQWQIIESIMREFYSGESRDNANRTIFVVGDEKQSIYSFQGADVSNFSKVDEYIKSKMHYANKPYSKIELEWVYRSAPEILQIASEIFKNTYLKNVELKCFRKDAKGCIEIWPLITAKEEAELRPSVILRERERPSGPHEAHNEPELAPHLQSQDPNSRSKLLSQDDEKLFWPSIKEMEEEESDSKKLAKKIALYIKNYIESGKIMPSTGKPAKAGDFMILIRRRNEFTDEIISELKEASISVAGIDRMRITDHLSAKDIIAAAKFALLPEDDLNLASLLKSPLINLEDKEIAKLAINRDKSLYNALPENKILENLIYMAQNLSAFDFFHNLIDVMNAREILKQSNGADSDDVLDELLNICISWSKIHGTNLQGFIHWLEKSDAEIKRDIEPMDNVRVMTVHAAKGLESPIVIMPDTMKVPTMRNNLLWKDGNFLWNTGMKSSNQLYMNFKQEKEDKDYEEYLRLLYVAITRAEDHLVVCGCGTKGKIDESCWYNIVKEAMENLGAKEGDEGNLWVGEYISSFRGDLKDRGGNPETRDAKHHPTLPGLLRFTSNDEEEQSKPNYVRSPLDLRMDISYGVVLHKVLEDSVKQKQFAMDMKHPYLAKLPEKLQNHIIKKLPKLFEVEEFKEILAYPNVQTEASMGYIEDGSFKFGRIDLLCMSEKEAIVIDYKSESSPPKTKEEVPELYQNQLKFYAEFIKKAYPNLQVTSKILWLENFSMMEIYRID